MHNYFKILQTLLYTHTNSVGLCLGELWQLWSHSHWKWIVRTVHLNSSWCVMLQFFSIVFVHFLKQVSHKHTQTMAKTPQFSCKMKVYIQNTFIPLQNAFVFKWRTEKIKCTNQLNIDVLNVTQWWMENTTPSIRMTSVTFFCTQLHLLQIQYISVLCNLKYCFHTQNTSARWQVYFIFHT